MEKINRMKKYAGRNGFDLFRGIIWHLLGGLRKTTNYCTPDVQYVRIQGNRISNRGGLRSEPRCSIRKTRIINSAILIDSGIQESKAQVRRADRANTHYK